MYIQIKKCVYKDRSCHFNVKFKFKCSNLEKLKINIRYEIAKFLLRFNPSKSSGYFMYYEFFICCVVCALLFFTLDAGLLAGSQYSGGPATGHLETDFSWFPCALRQMLRWFPRFQVATTWFSCSPPDLNLLVTNFIFCIHVK